MKLLLLTVLLVGVASASKPWPKKSESTQEVNLGLPNGGISKYSTTIINEQKAILEDRRKTPNPSPKKWRRSADPSKPWPKAWPKAWPKSSKSTQSVELGLPNGGISKYSTTIIGESKAILEDRRKTPNPSPKKWRRSAEPSKAWPKKPVSLGKSDVTFKAPGIEWSSSLNGRDASQSVDRAIPNGGISKYSTSVIGEKKAILEDRRKTPNPSPKKWRRSADPSKAWPKAWPKSSKSSQSVELGLPNGGISKYSTTIIGESKAILEDRRKTPNPSPKKWRRSADPSKPWPKAWPKSSKSTQSVELGLPNGGISKYSTTIIGEKKAILEDRRKTPNPSPKRW